MKHVPIFQDILKNLDNQSHNEDVEIEDVPAVTDNPHVSVELMPFGTIFGNISHALQSFLFHLEKWLHLHGVSLHDICHVTLCSFWRQEKLVLKGNGGRKYMHNFIQIILSLSTINYKFSQKTGIDDPITLSWSCDPAVCWFGLSWNSVSNWSSWLLDTATNLLTLRCDSWA